MNTPSRFALVIALLVAVVTMIGSASAQPAQCPMPAPLDPPATISSQLPVDVCIPAGFGSLPIKYFDDFSWRSFVALIWPALSAHRGAPDSSKTIADSGPRVFETLKADWEIFQPNAAPPAGWEETMGTNPCSLDHMQFGDFQLASFTKFGNLGQAGFGDLVGPLVAQNKTYVRYLAAFNKVEFDQIVDPKKKLYIQSNLVSVTFMPDSSGNNPLDIKSSWIDMTNIPHPERYYKRVATVFDPESGTCSEKTMGLVGLHIVTKTPSRPQWIWSTFEQVDNVPGSGAQAPFAFNDGTATPMPDPPNPISFPPPAKPPLVFNVTRLKSIDGSTQGTNSLYRNKLAAISAGPWQFYQLVMTQWPVPGNSPQNSGKPQFTFPGLDATTAFSNVTMETFDQKSISGGCMNCHNLTKKSSDFIWALPINASNPPAGTNASQPQLHVLMDMPGHSAAAPLLKELKQLMSSVTPSVTAKKSKKTVKAKAPSKAKSKG